MNRERCANYRNCWPISAWPNIPLDDFDRLFEFISTISCWKSLCTLSQARCNEVEYNFCYQTDFWTRTNKAENSLQISLINKIELELRAFAYMLYYSSLANSSLNLEYHIMPLLMPRLRVEKKSVRGIASGASFPFQMSTRFARKLDGHLI